MGFAVQMGLYRPGIEGGFERMGDYHIVPLVEHHMREGGKLAVYQKTTGNRLDGVAFESEQREKLPLIGYDSMHTHIPFISDPSGKVKGAIGIKEKRLIYSARAIPLHEMRDGYTWRYVPFMNEFYVEGEFAGIVREFLDAGYTLFLSDNMRGPDDQRVNIVGETTLDEILGKEK